MEFVPLAIFDLMVYTEEIGPVVLSLKTSLRERYKQAEFEAQALKSVHRLARTFLVTMDTPGEVSRVNLEIKQGVISGMNGVVIANRVEFDKVVKDIKSWGVIMAPSVPLVTGGKKVDRRKVLP